MHKLRTYINGLDADGKNAFAASVGTTLNYLRKAVSNGEMLRPSLCVAIEEKSGRAVTRKDLRRDWLEIWPELA